MTEKVRAASVRTPLPQPCAHDRMVANGVTILSASLVVRRPAMKANAPLARLNSAEFKRP